MTIITLTVQGESAEEILEAIARLQVGAQKTIERPAKEDEPIVKTVAGTPPLDAPEAPDPVKPKKKKGLPEEGTPDSQGTPFDSRLHTGTKNKNGTWRLRRGAKELIEEEAEAEDEAEAETEDEAEEPEATFEEAAEEIEEDFGFFEEEESETPDREWTDTDLSQACTKAATKMGNVTPIRQLIQRYVPEGEVAHSRNIPKNKRASFIAELSKLADVEIA